MFKSKYFYVGFFFTKSTKKKNKSYRKKEKKLQKKLRKTCRKRFVILRFMLLQLYRKCQGFFFFTYFCFYSVKHCVHLNVFSVAENTCCRTAARCLTFSPKLSVFQLCSWLNTNAECWENHQLFKFSKNMPLPLETIEKLGGRNAQVNTAPNRSKCARTVRCYGGKAP